MTLEPTPWIDIRAETPGSSVSLAEPVPTEGPLLPSRTPISQPTLTLESTSATPSTTHSLLLARCGDGRCLVLMNMGNDTIPLTGFRIMSGKSSIQGEDWISDELAIEDCLVVTADRKKWMPSSRLCGSPSSIVVVDEKKDFWEENISAYYQNELIGECSRKAKTCDFSFTGR